MDDDTRKRAIQASAAAVSALIGSTVAGPAGSIVGAFAGPALEPVMARVWGELVPESRACAARVLAEAATYAKIEVETLERQILRDEQRRLIGGLALSAGSRTRNSQKIRALGRALLDGVITEDDALIDESQLIIRALDDLETPHIAVLDLLVSYVPGPTPQPYTGTDSEKPVPHMRRWTIRQLGDAKPHLRPALSGLLGTLQRHGLAQEDQNVLQILEEYNMADERADEQFHRYRSSHAPLSRDRRIYPTQLMKPVTSQWLPTGLGSRTHEYLREVGHGSSTEDND